MYIDIWMFLALQKSAEFYVKTTKWFENVLIDDT
jgi:hypothetical protein